MARQGVVRRGWGRLLGGGVEERENCLPETCVLNNGHPFNIAFTSFWLGLPLSRGEISNEEAIHFSWSSLHLATSSVRRPVMTNHFDHVRPG